MRNTKIISTIILTVCLFTSCKGIYENTEEIADDLKSKVNSISISELKTIVENTEDFLLLDIRQASDYYTANIPGSILIPRGILEFNISSEDFWMEQYMYPPEKETEIVVYCNAGNNSVLAAFALKKLGFKNVKSLEGGYKAYNPNLDPNAKPKASSGGCGG
jgi:rhodanese-related sulfurtransferase